DPVPRVLGNPNQLLQAFLQIIENARHRIVAFYSQADLLVLELESFHLNCALQKRLQFEKTFFARGLLGKAEQIADEFARAPSLLADFLRVRELLAAEVAAVRHAFG